MSDVVRPFVLTGGRTRPRDTSLRLETMVQTAERAPAAPSDEARRILDLCRAARSIGEVAGTLGLPLGVATVLVGDLVADGALIVHHSDPVDIELSVLTRMIERVRSL